MHYLDTLSPSWSVTNANGGIIPPPPPCASTHSTTPPIFSGHIVTVRPYSTYYTLLNLRRSFALCFLEWALIWPEEEWEKKRRWWDRHDAVYCADEDFCPTGDLDDRSVRFIITILLLEEKWLCLWGGSLSWSWRWDFSSCRMRSSIPGHGSRACEKRRMVRRKMRKKQSRKISLRWIFLKL